MKDQEIMEKLRRKGEPLDSKIIFSKLLEHEGKASRRQLAKETGYPKETVGKRWKKWEYDERITQYHEYLIQHRAENSIKRINNLDNQQLDESETINTMKQTILTYLQEHLQETLHALTPNQTIKLFTDLPVISHTNNNNAHNAGNALLDNLKYITHDENTQLDITLPELQDILRGNYNVLAEAITKNIEYQREQQEKKEPKQEEEQEVNKEDKTC